MADRIRIEQRAGIGLATVMARKEIGAEQVGHALGMGAPIGPRWKAKDGLTLIGTGPNAWLAYRPGASSSWVNTLREQLINLASVSDQSSAYNIWRLSGAEARTVLQRGAAIDFDPDSFGLGSVATTVIAHIGVIIRQLDNEPIYEIATFRSYADSFSQWLDRTVAAL